MNFDFQKKQALEKTNKFDNSKKRSIDIQILPLINLINSHPDYYTTSSCAGRIMLFKESNAKNNSEWTFCSHDKIKISQLDEYLAILPKETLFLRMEPPILHISARDMDAAGKLLKFANDAGFRRSCILSFSKRIILEIMIPEKLDAPISEKNRLLVTKDYIKKLVKHANLRLSKSRIKLKKFEKKFTSLIKQQQV